MMTVAVGGIAFMWVTKMQEDLQEDITTGQADMAKKASASLTISSMWNDTDHSAIVLLLRNTGRYTFSKEEMQNIEIYLNGIPIGILNNTFNESTCVNNPLTPTSTCQAKSYVHTINAGSCENGTGSMLFETFSAAQYAWDGEEVVKGYNSTYMSYCNNTNITRNVFFNNLADKLTIKIIEPTTGVKTQYTCRIDEAGQDSC
ncbi:MAG: hypothetical protein B6U87_00600 [Candidatus Aenigmarchaeota archaeon ex4484_52]|nr:MAG: hypothetical protein B6U87_00600 [Candidatus Aenigmarchaeota archaeon ex4484_52]